MRAIESNCNSAIRRLVVVSRCKSKQSVWCKGYSNAKVSDSVVELPIASGMQERSHCVELYSSQYPAPGISGLGREQMLKTTFGNTTPLTFFATRSETNNGISWGYNAGAGSNEVGTERGKRFDGLP